LALVLDRPTPAPESPPSRSSQPDRALTRFLVVAAAASIVAGIVHAGAIAAHSETRPAVLTFLGICVVQLAWGAWALARPNRAVAAIGTVIALASLVGWTLAKTRGLTFIDGLETKEKIQLADGLCATLEAITLVTATAALFIRRRALPIPVMSILVTGMAFAMIPGTSAALDHQHSHPTTTVITEPAPAVPPRPFDPTHPIHRSGVPGVSPQQQARAENLLAATVHRLSQWADPAYDEANGFRSIHDGGTGVEHYVNRGFMEDDVMLDPDRPESLVFDTTVTPKKLVAAMYMAKPNMTLDQVPDVGGPLTQWHIHNNLCFTAEAKVGGLTRPDGTCPEGLFKGPETPMIHVWIEPHQCGPFAALEGVGGGQIKEGETRLCDTAHGSHTH
jgi:hypothetical protein